MDDWARKAWEILEAACFTLDDIADNIQEHCMMENVFQKASSNALVHNRLTYDDYNLARAACLDMLTPGDLNAKELQSRIFS